MPQQRCKMRTGWSATAIGAALVAIFCVRCAHAYADVVDTEFVHVNTKVQEKSQKARVYVPPTLCSTSKFERVLKCCDLPSILSSEDFRVCRELHEVWFRPPKPKRRPRALPQTTTNLLDNPLYKACVTTCVFKRNHIVHDNGLLSMENMTNVFLKFQTKDVWKAIITKSISFCFNEMKNTTRYAEFSCNIENQMLLTCVRKYLFTNCPSEAAKGNSTIPTCAPNMQLLTECNPFVKDPRIDLYPRMRRRKKRTTTPNYQQYEDDERFYN